MAHRIVIRSNPAAGKTLESGKQVGTFGPFATKAQAAAQAQVLADAGVISRAHNILVEAVARPKGRTGVSKSTRAARVSNPKKLKKTTKKAAAPQVVWTKLKSGDYSGKVGGAVKFRIVKKGARCELHKKSGASFRKVSGHKTITLAKKAAKPPKGNPKKKGKLKTVPIKRRKAKKHTVGAAISNPWTQMTPTSGRRTKGKVRGPFNVKRRNPRKKR